MWYALLNALQGGSKCSFFHAAISVFAALAQRAIGQEVIALFVKKLFSPRLRCVFLRMLRYDMMNRSTMVLASASLHVTGKVALKRLASFTSQYTVGDPDITYKLWLDLRIQVGILL